MIGGNITVLFQIKDTGKKNAIGERETGWLDIGATQGFLDFSAGDSKHEIFNAKIQESTHIFLCDYRLFKKLQGEVTPENARVLIDGKIYQIQLVDDPMNLHQHMEIYLKFVGGQDGSTGV